MHQMMDLNDGYGFGLAVAYSGIEFGLKPEEHVLDAISRQLPEVESPVPQIEDKKDKKKKKKAATAEVCPVLSLFQDEDFLLLLLFFTGVACPQACCCGVLLQEGAVLAPRECQGRARGSLHVLPGRTHITTLPY